MDDKELTIERGFRKCVSWLRAALVAVLAVCLWDGMRFEEHIKAKPDKPAETATQPTTMPSSTQPTSPAAAGDPALQTGGILRDGVIRVNSGWSRHPVLSAIFYLLVHEGLVTMTIGWILLGKRREPSRAQMTAAYWAGLVVGLGAWTVFWGYHAWYWYFLVFVTNTFFMSAVSRYTASGRSVLKRVTRS